MATGATGFLVIRREDGYGDVFQLVGGQRYTLGRSATARIVLKDELCSREHAEVYFAEKSWRIRDLSSLNGTKLDGKRLDREEALSPGSIVHLGRSDLVFVEQMAQLPEIEPAESTPVLDESVAIKKRLGQTRFLTPLPPTDEPALEEEQDAERTQPAVPAVAPRHNLSRDLSLLYRLALNMGSALDQQELLDIVLEGLLEGITADVGAVLSIKDGGDLEVGAYRHRQPGSQGYTRPSQYVSNEVLASREAILAENVARDRYLRNRESLTESGVTSLICAPVVFGEKILCLIHLYCTDLHRSLDVEDLEFAMAVAKQLGVALHQIRRQESLSKENKLLRAQLRVESELVGTSKPMKDIEEQIRRVAATNATVLVRGESGSGKELIARAIHYSSARREGPFVCLNCAALSETLLESELFGHEKGAFTGATEKKIGKFEAADHGTIFLDEIGEMSPTIQAKFLRVLEGHPYERVGGNVPIRSDVRVVAATNLPLEEAVRAGQFRRDLFFRLQVVEVSAPPLRERRDDIPLLADHFLKRFVRDTGRKLRGFTPAALRKMQDYNWPGNVRELRNVIERAVALGNGPFLDGSDIWLSSLELSPLPSDQSVAVMTYEALSLEEIEKRHIFDTLQHTDWNKSHAASILGIERSTLDRKIKAYDLKR